MATQTAVRQDAQEIHDQFEDRDADVDVDVEDIEDRLSELVEEYKVPREEARKSVISHIEDEHGLGDDDYTDYDNPEVLVDSIDEAEEWIDITVEVVELWEPRADAIGQVGLVGDESGTIKFTAWAESELPTLQEGETYRLESVVTDEYQGQYSVKLNSATDVEAVDETIDVGSEAGQRLVGSLVAIQDGSGLIKRCPEEGCTRPLTDGRCADHGDVDGEFDLRIKGVIDDGDTSQKVIFDRETTELVAGTSLEEAKQMAMDALDTTVVAQQFREDLLGLYFAVEGRQVGDNLLVDDVQRATGEIDTEDTLINARSI